MALNFGAFVGGFSEQLVKDLEAEEERKFEMEKIATTEAMRQRAAASSRRRSEQLATEQMMKGLSMFYTDPEIVSYIMQSGEAGYEFAMEQGPLLAARGMSGNSLFRLADTDGDMSDPATQRFFTETIDAAQAPEAEINMGADAAPAPTTSLYGLNPQVYAQLHGEPTEDANSYGAALARISQQLSRTTDENERARLEAQKRAIIDDYIEFEHAGKPPQEEQPFFTAGTLSTNVREALQSARNRYGFETDLEGNILNMTEGNEHRSYVAELFAAQTLEATYGDVNDRGLNNRINIMRDQATSDLIAYGRRIISEGDSRRLRAEADQQTFTTNLIGGQYRVGDVVTYVDDNGNVQFVIYTGIPNRGLPVPGRSGEFLPIVVGR